MIKMSFILPCYNVDRYIAGCLESIYSQDIPENDYEVICVNDCSTDNTRNIILSYIEDHSNLRLIDHTENLTAGGARNTGITAAKGESIWFVDPDDVIKRNCLQELIGKVQEMDADVLFFNFDDADVNLKVIREDRTYPDSAIYNGQEFVTTYFKDHFATFGIIWRAIFKTQFLREKGLQYPIMRKAQDVVFLWKVMLCASRVCSVSKSYYTYRSNPYSVTKHETLAKVAFSDRVLRGYEIAQMLETNTIRPELTADMLKNLKWCANSSSAVLSVMSQEERRKYYREIIQHKKAVRGIIPYMNRKNKFLVSTLWGKHIWLLKVNFVCRRKPQK